MNRRQLFTILVFILLIFFSFTIVYATNRNIEEMYKRNYRSSFELLSFLIENYLKDEEELRETEIEETEKKIDKLVSNLKNNINPISGNIHGIWIIRDGDFRGLTSKENIETEIFNFYSRNLKNSNKNSLIFIDNESYYLANYQRGPEDILVLIGSQPVSGARIKKFLDSLVVSSRMLYYSVLDSDRNPLLFSSLYENYLPLKGEGYHIIETPEREIFQIEKIRSNQYFVAGFSMESLNRIQSRNIYILIAIIILFSLISGFLIMGLIKFDRFKTSKEKELSHLRELGAISGGFTHEFRNSLNTLSLLSGNLEGQNKQVLKKEVKRMQNIIDSFKLLGTGDIKTEKHHLNKLINESISIIKKSMKKDLKIENRVDEKFIVEGDRILLVTALSNLMKNSGEAEASIIILNARKIRNMIEISITDDGHGFKEEEIDRIFEPFYSSKKHSGLGLYLTEKIIELHGGKIDVKSNDRTQFTITLKVNR